MNNSQNNAAKAGAGIAALAAAAAGAYYFFGKNGQKHQKRVTQWAKKAKQDVVKELKKLETFSRPAYEKAVSQVMDEYAKIKSLDGNDVAQLGKELKSHWNSIAQEIKKTIAQKTPAKKPAAKKAKSKAKK